MITLRSPGMKPSPVITTFTPNTSSSKDYRGDARMDGGWGLRNSKRKGRMERGQSKMEKWIIKGKKV